eukprot:TRINITY_DN6361_c0_g4_i1.p1 TRINITY_DN6361_c0_g4~~TRINITY_DN6361_c0_g4_i1.p1  ORF type:complete len:642 (-),score=43.19 TRINITY_DN6361_c0_g4_i1:157-2082(-)
MPSDDEGASQRERQPRQLSRLSTFPLAHRFAARRLLRLLSDPGDAWRLMNFSSRQSGTAVCASRWGVTREDLRSFAAEVRAAWKAGLIPEDPEHPNVYHDNPSIGPNIYAVCKHFIKPRTMEAGVSWALMKHPEGLPCDAFVTHSWHEGIFEFVNKVDRLWPADARNIYCCFLSNPQNGDVSAMLGKSAMKSPFAVALAASKYLLVIPNCQQSIYTRLWCVFEAHLALKLGLRIFLPNKPRCRDMLYAALPRLAIFALTCAIQIFYINIAESRLEELIVRIVTISLVFLSPCLLTFLDIQKSVTSAVLTWLPFVLSGLYLGVLLSAPVSKYSRDVPGSEGYRNMMLWFGFRFVVVAVLFVAMLEQSLRVLAAKVVCVESGLLHFESVRDATCSDPIDEVSIRECIAGNEDLIDSAIRTLKTVGYYNHHVHNALWLGVPVGRLRLGTSWALTLLAANYAVGGIFTFICPAGLSRDFPIQRTLPFFLGAVLGILWLVVRVLPEPRVFAIDSLVFLAIAVYSYIDLVNLWFTGDIDEHELPNKQECQAVPWYVYMIGYGLLWFSWICSLTVLYKCGLNCVHGCRTDGARVAGSYYTGAATTLGSTASCKHSILSQSCSPAAFVESDSEMSESEASTDGSTESSD